MTQHIHYLWIVASPSRPMEESEEPKGPDEARKQAVIHINVSPEEVLNKHWRGMEEMDGRGNKNLTIYPLHSHRSPLRRGMTLRQIRIGKVINALNSR